MYVRIVAAMTFGAALICSAQTTNLLSSTRFLSLRDCVDLALKRNLDLQIEHLMADIAGYNYRASYGAYDPVFSASAQHNFISQPGNFDPKKSGYDYPYELDTDTINAGLSGRLPMGLSYNFQGLYNPEKGRTDFSSSPENALLYPPAGIRETNNFFGNAGVTLQQHLLKDFWIDQYRERLLVRRKELKMSQQALRFQLMKTVLAVELAYYDLVASLEQVQTQEKAVQLSQQFVDETRHRVRVGDLPPLDSEQAETQLQNSLTALSSAREAAVDRQNALKSLITDDFLEWADAELKPSDSLIAIQTTVNRSESFALALKNRPDLIEARLAVQRSDVTVQFRKNQLFPNLDLVGNYGGLGIDPEASSMVSDVLHFRQPEYFYGVVVSFPLSNVGARNEYRASKAAKNVAELQLKRAEQQVLVQIADWVNRVQTRYDQVSSTRQARRYAESALSAEEKKLQNGLSTSFFVLQLQRTLTGTRFTEVQALADYNKALAQLAFSEGNTLERRNLVLQVQ